MKERIKKSSYGYPRGARDSKVYPRVGFLEVTICSYCRRLVAFNMKDYRISGYTLIGDSEDACTHPETIGDERLEFDIPYKRKNEVSIS